MKRVISILLVLLMVFSLLACSKSSGKKEPSKPSADAGPSVPKETTPLRDDIEDVSPDILKPDEEKKDVDSNDAYITPDKFGGKKLQIYGLSGIVYEDVDNMREKGDFLYMMRAAADEWAALNNVTLEYVGDWNSAAIIGNINAGEKPDLLMFCTDPPQPANLGISRAFTQEEYDAIAKIIGNGYLDLMNYKGESHGLVYPWGGCSWFWYNETMFETYGAKTPWEYYVEGNWTWETMEDCWESVTKDFDGNGKIDKTDTYGCSTYVYLSKAYQLTEGDDGKLTACMDTSNEFRTYAEMVYRGFKETLSLAGPHNQRCYITTSPRPGTHIGDCEWYNFEHLYRVNDLGDVIRAIPYPVVSKENPTRWTQYTEHTMSIMSSCDEPEATLSLICYMMKVGMRYMADFSCGLYKCSYEGMRGSSEYSKAYLTRLAELLEERRAMFAEITDWDQDVYAQMVEDVLTAPGYVQKRYSGQVQISDKIKELPPASSIPLLAQSQKAWILKYNELYAK